MRRVARIGKPHGIRGEVTVETMTDEPEQRFAVGSTLETQARPGSGVPRELTVRTARSHNGIWLLSFDGVPDRTGAEGLRGTMLGSPDLAGDDDADDVGNGNVVHDDDADDDGYYEEDLLGIPVELLGGERVGVVDGLELGAAQDRLVIAIDGPGARIAAVPFVRELVPTVDVPGRRIVIDPPDGLLDLS